MPINLKIIGLVTLVYKIMWTGTGIQINIDTLNAPRKPEDKKWSRTSQKSARPTDEWNIYREDDREDDIVYNENNEVKEFDQN